MFSLVILYFSDSYLFIFPKMNEEPGVPVLDSRYPYRYWSIAGKKGYGISFLSFVDLMPIPKLTNYV